MAPSGRKQSSQTPGTVPGGPKGGPKGKAPAGKAPTGRAPTGKGRGGRVSVAAARRTSGDRTQLIIGGVAIVVIIAIIAIGLVLYNKSSATQGSGYGVSKQSTASVDGKGIITVSNGNPSLVLDLYEDGLCPACAQFEHQFGQQISKAMDQGQLTARYHMVDFLNASSHSGTYSTRAYAALIAVAKNDGGKAGLFMRFHTALYDPANQPKEQGSSDLSNAQLASLAGSVGASKKTQDEISSGADVAAAKTDAAANVSSLQALAAKAGSSNWGTPTVAKDGTIVAINNVDWLTNLLPKSAQGSGAVSGTTGGTSTATQAGTATSGG